jgi:hypothetical protein
MIQHPKYLTIENELRMEFHAKTAKKKQSTQRRKIDNKFFAIFAIPMIIGTLRSLRELFKRL